MSDILVKNSRLSGDIIIPPSKSVAHRAIICAALSEGTSTLSPISESEDMTATLGAIKALGADYKRNKNTLTIYGANSANGEHKVIDCIESGSTLRFMIPIAGAKGGSYEFTGRGRLPQRPIGCYEDLLTSHGVDVKYNGTLPFICKGQLKSGTFSLPGNISSQYITGLLLALPLLDGDSEIVLTTPLESSAYVDITIDVMKKFGVGISKTQKGYFIQGNQQYKGCNFSVESDWSQGAFFLCAGALGADICVKGLNTSSVQGDSAVIEILQNMGADISETDGGFVFSQSDLHSITFDAKEIPDIVPILAVTAMFCKGVTHIKNCARLRIKESDRLSATLDLILAFGGICEIKGDDLYITGVEQFNPYRKINGFNDHRIVMSAAIAGAFAGGETLISDRQSVNKSYPNFFDDYNKLGGISNDI